MKKRIEVVEPDGFKVGPIHHECGDIFTSEQGQHFIDLGWAKCCETGDCGKRIEGVSKIKPDSVIQPAA